MVPQIARDMERWAKNLNAAKDATKAAMAAAEAQKAVMAASQQVNVLRAVEQAPLSLESLQAARQVEARFEQGVSVMFLFDLWLLVGLDFFVSIMF